MNIRDLPPGYAIARCEEGEYHSDQGRPWRLLSFNWQDQGGKAWEGGATADTPEELINHAINLSGPAHSHHVHTEVIFDISRGDRLVEKLEPKENV
jgi:hypothetical protein